MNILEKLKEKVKDKKKLAIVIGVGLVIIILASTVMFIGKKKGVSKTNSTVNVSDGTTTLDKKTANGLDSFVATGENGEILGSEGETFEITLSPMEEYKATETVPEDNSKDKQEETADISDNKLEPDEIEDEAGDGIEYELDAEMEKQDAEAESIAKASDVDNGYSGDAAKEFIFKELMERDQAQLDMGIQSGLGE